MLPQLKSIKEKINKFYASIDKHLRRVEIHCGKGCNYCCRHPIYVTFLEGLYVEDYLKHLPHSEFELIKTEWHKWYSKCKELDLFLPPDFKWFEKRFRDKRYFEYKVDCPFLINNECKIYEVRPVICRTYYSKVAPEFCNGTRIEPESHYLYTTKLREIRVLQQNILPYVPLDLTLLAGHLADLFLKPGS